MHQLINNIFPLKHHFRGIIFEFHPSMKKGKNGFWIYFAPNEPVGHYLCLVECRDKIYFFDPLGEAPDSYGLFIECKFVPFRIQSEISQNCGLFCLFFAYHALFLPNYKAVITRYFSESSFRFNEKVVKSWLVSVLS